MSTSMLILARVITRRVDSGMSLEAALGGYTKLSEQEREEIERYVSEN